MRCTYTKAVASYHTSDGTLHTFAHTFAFEDITKDQFIGLVLPWCVDQFGEDPENDAWWRFGYAIALVSEDDAVAFRMRWGGLIDD